MKRQIRCPVPIVTGAISIISIVVMLLSGCALDEKIFINNPIGEGRGSSNETPIFVSSQTVSVNVTQLFEHTSWHETLGEHELNVLDLLGLLVDDQHVLDAEVVSAIENASPLNLPAFTMGGNISGGTNDITGVGAFKTSYISLGEFGLEEFVTNSDAAGPSINYFGYDGGSTRFRDFDIYDGKTSRYALFDGSQACLTVDNFGATTLQGTINANNQNFTNLGTLSAFTLGGELNAGGQSITNINAIYGRTNAHFYLVNMRAGGAFFLQSRRTDGSYGIIFETYNASNANTSRVSITSGTDEATINFSNSVITGIKLGETLNLNGNYLYFSEQAAPGSGSADTVKIYAVEGAGALTDMAAVFQDGTVDIFAQETTSLDAPIFRYPSGTQGSLKMIKEHPGLVVIVMVFSDGSQFELKRIEYHDYDKVMANKGSVNPLPVDWLVETALDRQSRLIEEELERQREMELIQKQ